MTTFVNDPITRKSKELNSLIALPLYAGVVDTLTRRILSFNCCITIDESKINPTTGKEPRTRYQSKTIFLIKRVDERLPDKFHNDGKAFIYILLHEFGHHLDLDTQRNNCREELAREIRAWCYAHKEFKKLQIEYPFLKSAYDDFLEYGSFCISTYESTCREIAKKMKEKGLDVAAIKELD